MNFRTCGFFVVFAWQKAEHEKLIHNCESCFEHPGGDIRVDVVGQFMLNDAGTQLALAHPLVVVLIALGVLALWCADPRRPRYLLYFGSSYLLYAAGAASQVVHLPSSHAHNVLFSGMMYLLAVIVFAQGLIALSGTRPRYAVPMAILIAAMACRAYFLFIEENGVLRSYCLNGRSSAARSIKPR